MDTKGIINNFENSQKNLEEVAKWIKEGLFQTSLKKNEIDDLDTATFIVAIHLEDTIKYLKKVMSCQED